MNRCPKKIPSKFLSAFIAITLSAPSLALAVVEVPVDAPACAALLVAQHPVVDPAPIQLDPVDQLISQFEPEFDSEFQNQFGSTAKILWQRFKLFRGANLLEPFNEIFQPEQVEFIFSDPRHYVYFKNLSKILDSFQVPTPTEAEPNPVYLVNADQNFKENLTASLSVILHNQVPHASIIKRIEALFQKQETDTLKRALGDNTLAEVSELYFGNDLYGSPSQESLLGQWVQTNGVQPIRRRFPETQGGQNVGPNTPERFVIPIDATGLPSFQQLFNGPNWLSIIGHARLVNGGKVFSFSDTSFSNYNVQGAGSILPVTLLSTSEAQRLWGYAILMNKYNVIANWMHPNQLAHHPWDIPGFLTARNIYSCCTKWIGDMPIGDALVEEYSFPGHRDQTLEVRARLQTYNHADPLVKRIWTAPGHMQFSEMLGLKDAQIRGEFANTGWIYQILLTQADTVRVPFVFIWTANQKDALLPQFNYRHEFAH